MLKRDTRVQIVIIKNGKFIMLKHHFKKENRCFWGIPGGGIEEGETDTEAAIRETYEETGLKVKLLPVKFKYPVDYSPVYKNVATFIALIEKGEAKLGYEPEAEAKDLYELVELKWFPMPIYENDETHPDINGFALKEIKPVQEFLKSDKVIKRAGAVIYRMNNNSPEYLMVSAKNYHHVFIFPQGKKEKGETFSQTAVRETREESGWDVLVKKKLGFQLEIIHGKIFMTYLFLCCPVKENPSYENRTVKWMSQEDLMKSNIYQESKDLLKDIEYELNKQ